MKLKKKAAIIIIVAVAIFIIIWNVCKSPLEKKVFACQKYSWPYWKLGSVQENKEEKHIIIVYDRDWPGTKKNICIKRTCDALYEKLLENQDSQYCDYSIDIRFRIVGEAETLNIFNMTTDLADVRVHNFSMTCIPLKTIVECFPYASELSVDGVTYRDTITDIKGFENLRYFHYNSGLSKKQKEYISSLYPNCVIECLEEN